MNILALPAALAFTMNLTLCLIVLSSNPKDIAHRLFAGFVLSFATWNMGELIMINSLNPIHAIFGVRLIFAGLAFAPLFFLHFSFVFPDRGENRWAKGWKPFALYLIPLALSVAFSLTLRIDVERFKDLRNVFYYGLRFEEPFVFLLFFSPLALFSGICIYWGIKNLLRSLQTTRIPRQKLQIKYLIFGMVTMALTGSMINLSNHLLKLGWPTFFLASLYSILVSLFFAIALIRYRLLDIHLLIRGGIVYSSVSGLVLAIYVLIIKNIGEAISQKAYGKSLLVESALILCLVFVLRPLQRKVGDWIDRFFYMDRIRFRTKLSEFGRALAELVDLDGIARTMDSFITQTFHVDRFAFFFLTSDGNEYLPVGERRNAEHMKWSSESALVKKFEESHRAIDLEHLRGKEGKLEEMDALIEQGWTAVVPVYLREEMVGFMLLGRKRSEKDYTAEEMELLTTFSNQAALAISRALVYREMSLKEKEMMQVEKMAAIGELAAGIAHEIRNPLGIISGSAETIRKHEDPTLREEMIGYILEEARRINGLVTNLLDFARPKEPKLEKCDLREILEKTLLLCAPRARVLGVEIRKKMPEKPLWVSADSDQMRQAFTNIGVNALEAMPEGGLLSVTVAENGRGWVVIRFTDSGKGIPEAIRSKLFHPFFTTKEGGTGLGLSIAQRIIAQHGGEIFLEENKGSGATFSVCLSLAPPPEETRCNP